ncbi:MAG: SAM-dependent methyltransferase [Prolixibacteraceae bacterium]|nr:SAM-dependent methyltransferase [Prolixibacteraceae bacterium]
MNDPIGQAVFDYYRNKNADDIIVESNYTENEIIPPSYFFREEKDLPFIEKEALNHCKGRILDVGAGAGCHSVILQEKGFNVTAVEKSSLLCKVLEFRGIKKIFNRNIYEISGIEFDTLLLLMNGAGIAGDLEGLSLLLIHLKKLMNPGGRILIDSSDISYLFEVEDGSVWIDLAQKNYYGEMVYTVKYKNFISEPFKWLFVDFNKMKTIAAKCGFSCRKITDGNHFDYLAELTVK